jgi:alkanesulfonate monooxygenase SsuD/methylene tetrahydromethanopterin reductase-like flavin-dependent oxidoreductase (luciferase family)
VLHFGLYLGTQRSVGSDNRASLADDVALARYLDRAGWDSAWKGQHFLLDDTVGSQPAPLLGRLAGEVERLTLGVGVLLLALHNPVEVAETYATLDALCGGRFIFGAGIGYRRREYEAFGIDPRRRGERFERNLVALVRLWTEEVVDIDLPWCRVDRGPNTARPVRPPPIWVGGGSERAVDRAGRLGDAWIIGGRMSLARATELTTVHAKARATSGRAAPSAQPLVREIFCARSRETAIETALSTMTEIAPGDDPLTALVDHGVVVGGVSDCIEQLDTWIEQLGVDYFVLRAQWPNVSAASSLDSLRRLSDEVLPELRARHPEPGQPT